MNDLGQTPYLTLGKQLKTLRARANESLAETSGAVEIDARELANYELGKSCPAEDVLLLLISHLGAKDDEAVQLWEMAGYGSDKSSSSRTATSADKPTADKVPRILYSDAADVMVNSYGVVMTFMQSGQDKASGAVARIGMSREHAKSVLRILQSTLTQTESSQPQRIPSADTQDTQN